NRRWPPTKQETADDATTPQPDGTSLEDGLEQEIAELAEEPGAVSASSACSFYLSYSSRSVASALVAARRKEYSRAVRHRFSRGVRDVCQRSQTRIRRRYRSQAAGGGLQGPMGRGLRPRSSAGAPSRRLRRCHHRNARAGRAGLREEKDV